MTAPPLRPGRTITGMSAILLPFTDDGEIDWAGFVAHVDRSAAAGLTPAVNMDTGYVQLLDPATRAEVLAVTAGCCDDFVAGAFVADSPGDPFDAAGYLAEIDAVAGHGGTPVIFPSHGLNAGHGDDWLAAHHRIADGCDRFIGFELGAMFVPYGRIFDLDTYRGLLEIDACIGAKHSSLDRGLEWQRLTVRDEVRPGFHVFTGNDLGIDMVMYGSDYLLGLSTMAPDAFAERDRRWAAGEASFRELNDLLQYLGFFTFRPPVPGYRHNAAQVLRLRGWIDADATPPGAPRRPDSDEAVLADIVERIEDMLG